MKEQILKLIADKPKHFSKMIANNPGMLAWVREHSKIESEVLAEHIYSAIHGVTKTCHRGNTKKFVNITTGFGGCGKAATCQCVREAVSSAVTHSKSMLTADEQLAINKKRAETNLERYGIECSAQRPEVIAKHQAWYAKPENVARAVEQVKATSLERYGVANPMQHPEIAEKSRTNFLNKYGVDSVFNLPNTRAGAIVRNDDYKVTGYLLTKGYERTCSYAAGKKNMTILTPRSEYTGCSRTLRCKCNACGTEMDVTNLYRSSTTCRTCNPILPSWVSGEEKEVFDFITTELGIPGKQADKSLISPYELDMVFPTHKIAVEYCGLYWHSEESSGKDSTYHRNKMLRAGRAGYRLITVFSDEWTNTRDAVKGLLADAFGKHVMDFTGHSIIVIDSADAMEFHRMFGVYEPENSDISFCIFMGGAPVSVMSLVAPRQVFSDDVIENKFRIINHTSTGVDNKTAMQLLIDHAFTVLRPESISCRLDMRWGNIAAHTAMGFNTASQDAAELWYVENHLTRHHRKHFARPILLSAGADPSLSDWDIMKMNKYDRIWDCGHQWVVYTRK